MNYEVKRNLHRMCAELSTRNYEYRPYWIWNISGLTVDSEARRHVLEFRLAQCSPTPPPQNKKKDCTLSRVVL